MKLLSICIAICITIINLFLSVNHNYIESLSGSMRNYNVLRVFTLAKMRNISKVLECTVNNPVLEKKILVTRNNDTEILIRSRYLAGSRYILSLKKS